MRGVKPQGGEIRAALFDNARDFSVDLEVRAMISPDGEISAGVFTQEEHFPHPPAQTAFASPTAKTIVLRFTALNPGDYAAAVFQDRNGNGRVDMTLGRIAVEPWGMSNNPRPKDRAPTWDDAKIVLPAEGARIVIDLR